MEDVAFIPQSGRVWALDAVDPATVILHWNGTAWH
jgi:hypothetical protein